MLKVMTIVGTRPEIIRLSRVIAQLDLFCAHTLVHTGQNYDYELNQVFFEELEIRKPDHFLDAAGATPAETIGNVIIKIDKAFETYQPEAILILGDTNSALTAIAAKRRKIPIFHMEAGNRCFDFRVPEEINRRIVDHISDINLTYSQIAREYLLREGLPPDQIICTGSPMREVLEFYAPKIEKSTILNRLNLEKEKYFIFSAHREENVDNPDNLQKIFDILNGLASDYGHPVIVTTHPRTRKRIEALGLNADQRVQFHKPFGFLDYIKLQTNAKVVLSDSGTITEESSILNFPALNIREVQERPEGFEEGAVMMVGLNFDIIKSATAVLFGNGNVSNYSHKIVKDYETVLVSDKITKIIISYTSFVNRKTWHRV
jgi:UDP-N-acetylglucosamine 2-epimerase (non-hydrolysing)